MGDDQASQFDNRGCCSITTYSGLAIVDFVIHVAFQTDVTAYCAHLLPHAITVKAFQPRPFKAKTEHIIYQLCSRQN